MYGCGVLSCMLDNGGQKKILWKLWMFLPVVNLDNSEGQSILLVLR